MIYFIATFMVFLVPLLFSRSAKRGMGEAFKIVAITAGVIVALIAVLLPLGAALVGEFRLSDYFVAIAFYLSPAPLVLLLWWCGLQVHRWIEK